MIVNPQTEQTKRPEVNYEVPQVSRAS